LLYADGFVVFHLFVIMDISITASSVTAAVVLGAVILQAETKMVPMTMTMATTNKMRHGTPSTPLFNLVQGRARARARLMRVRVAVIVVGGSGKDTIIPITINRCHC
jgi:hypothetical protein